MPFQRIDSEKLSKSVVRQVEQLILRGILRPGERLPSERELAEKLAVSRPSLREALSELQQAGLLTARAGAGIFVAEVLGYLKVLRVTNFIHHFYQQVVVCQCAQFKRNWIINRG